MNDQRLRRRDYSRARSELAARYLPLAKSLALRYRRTQEPIEDLMQVASLRLVKAIDRWDPERGATFASFAVPTILGELRHYFRDYTWMVRPPRALQELALQVMRVRNQLWSAQGREPTVADLATALDRTPQLIIEAIAAAEGRHAISLDAPTAEDSESTTHLDQLAAADAALAAVDDRLLADHLVRSLDTRASAVLRMRFELDLRQYEIAEHAADDLVVHVSDVPCFARVTVTAVQHDRVSIDRRLCLAVERCAATLSRCERSHDPDRTSTTASPRISGQTIVRVRP